MYLFGESIWCESIFSIASTTAGHTSMKIEVVMGLIMMLLVNHIIACLWYGIGSWSLGCQGYTSVGFTGFVKRSRRYVKEMGGEGMREVSLPDVLFSIF